MKSSFNLNNNNIAKQLGFMLLGRRERERKKEENST